MLKVVLRGKFHTRFHFPQHWPLHCGYQHRAYPVESRKYKSPKWDPKNPEKEQKKNLLLITTGKVIFKFVLVTFTMYIERQ